MDFSRNVRILTWQGFLVGFNLWSPLAAIYFSNVSGSYALGMSVFATEMISAALFEIPTGVFSDKIGRKYSTMLGSLFYTLSFVFYAIGINYWFLFIGALLEGLARSFYSGNNDALLFDSLNSSKRKEELEKWMGYIGSAEQWSIGIASIIGGFLYVISSALVMWLSVIPHFISFLMSFWLIDTKIHSGESGNVYLHLKDSLKNFLSNKKIRYLSLSEIIGHGIGESSFYFRPVFVAMLWPAWAIGVASAMANVAAAIGFGFSGKLMKKFKAENVLLFEQIYSMVTSLVSFVFPSVLSPAMLSSTSLLYGPSTVAQNSLMQREFNDAQRATMGSLNSLAKNIFYGACLVAVGWVADRTTPKTALIGGQILALIAVYMTWKLVKLIRAEKRA